MTTVGSVKHQNMLPQPAAASSTRVSSPFEYNGSGAGGVGGGGSVGGGVGGSGGTVGGGIGASIQPGARISPHALLTRSMKQSSTSTSTICTLFGRPNPIESRRISDRYMDDERQRTIDRYGFDPHTCRYVPPASSCGSSATSTGLSNRHH